MYLDTFTLPIDFEEPMIQKQCERNGGIYGYIDNTPLSQADKYSAYLLFALFIFFNSISFISDSLYVNLHLQALIVLLHNNTENIYLILH